MAARQSDITPEPPSKRGRTFVQKIPRLLIPGPLRRLDRWLLLHQPLVWRTRAHYFLWFSLILANLALFALGWFYPISRTNVPTIGQVDGVMAWLQLLGWLALALWAIQQFRAPLGEFGLRSYLLTWLLYAACFFTVLINPISMALPVVERIAAVTSDEKLAHDYAFHERYGFWCCHPELYEDVVESNEEAIRGALRDYGLNEEFEFDWSDKHCNAVAHCLVQKSAFSRDSVPLPLGNVLNSIAAAKEYKRGSGVYFERTIPFIPSSLLISIFAALALTLAVLPSTLRNRRLGMSDGRFFLPSLRLPRPQFIGRLDRSLRIRKPLIWATGLQSFLFMFLAYGILGLGVVFGAMYFVTGKKDFLNGVWEFFGKGDLGLLGVLGVFAIPSGIWAIRQVRAPLDAVTIITNQFALLLYFVALLWPQIFILVLVYSTVPSRDVEGVLVLAMAIVISLSYLVGLVFLGKYLDGRWTILSLVLGALAWSVLWVSKILGLSGNGPSIFVFSVWSALAIITWAASRVRKAWPALALLSAGYIMFIPLGLLAALGFFAGSSYVDWTKPLVWGLSIGIPLYLVTVIPALKALIRYRYWPKP